MCERQEEEGSLSFCLPFPHVATLRKTFMQNSNQQTPSSICAMENFRRLSVSCNPAHGGGLCTHNCRNEQVRETMCMNLMRER